MAIPEGVEDLPSEKDLQSELNEAPKEKDIQWADGYNREMHNSADYFTKWNTMMQEFLSGGLDKDNGGARNAGDRLQQVSKIFFDLNAFWNDAIKAVPDLYKSNGNGAERAEFVSSSWQKIVQMNLDAHQAICNSWIDTIPQQKKETEKPAEDRPTPDEKLKRALDAFDKTIRQYFEIPGFGLTKQHTELLKMAQAEFAQLASVLPFFYQYLQDTQWSALKQASEKVQELKIDGSTPEKLREIYKIWLMTNENAFHQLFKRSDFCHAMGEVINCIFRLRKRMDELANKWCATLSIPSSHDYDQMAMAIQSLRRKVRSQEKTIVLLQKQIMGKEKKGGDGDVN